MRFDSAIALALRLITKNGLETTLVTHTAGGLADPNKPWIHSESSTTTETVFSVWFEFGAVAKFGQAFLDQSTTIEVGDKQVFIAASGLTNPPTNTSQLIRLGETWEVVTVRDLSPNDQTILYELGVRK